MWRIIASLNKWIAGSDNGVSLVQCQTNISAITISLLIITPSTDSREILIKMQPFSYKKLIWKWCGMAAILSQPQCVNMHLLTENWQFKFECVSYLKIPLKMVILRIALYTYHFMYSRISYISMFAIMHFSLLLLSIYASWHGIQISNDMYLSYTFVYFCVFIVFIWIYVIVSNDEIKIFNKKNMKYQEWNGWRFTMRKPPGWYGLCVKSWTIYKLYSSMWFFIWCDGVIICIYIREPMYMAPNRSATIYICIYSYWIILIFLCHSRDFNWPDVGRRTDPTVAFSARMLTNSMVCIQRPNQSCCQVRVTVPYNPSSNYITPETEHQCPCEHPNS